MLSNNKISTIGNLGEFLPNLENIFMMGNRIKVLSEVAKLANCPLLSNLVLYNNPVAQLPNYRQGVVTVLLHLKTLDFKKIEEKDREKNILLRG